jgi:hypothetical protein
LSALLLLPPQRHLHYRRLRPHQWQHYVCCSLPVPDVVVAVVSTRGGQDDRARRLVQAGVHRCRVPRDVQHEERLVSSKRHGYGYGYGACLTAVGYGDPAACSTRRRKPIQRCDHRLRLLSVWCATNTPPCRNPFGSPTDAAEIKSLTKSGCKVRLLVHSVSCSSCLSPTPALCLFLLLLCPSLSCACLSVCPSAVCMSLSLSLSVCPSMVCLSVCASVCLSVLSVCLSAYLPALAASVPSSPHRLGARLGKTRLRCGAADALSLCQVKERFQSQFTHLLTDLCVRANVGFRKREAL